MRLFVTLGILRKPQPQSWQVAIDWSCLSILSCYADDMNDRVKLHDSWKTPLAEEFASDRMIKLREFLQSEKASGKAIFPKGSEIFRALDLTPLDKVRVVILGQDPYHGPGQAHGLCFSVKPGVRPPPSLVNIYKEMHGDLGITQPKHGFLEHWADQGVLLLNSVLTVEAHQAASHRGKGWEQFTDAIVQLIAARESSVVFLLWGSYAQKKAAFVKSVENGGHHMVLQAPHPSPLSAHKGFLGCKHFGMCNNFLAERALKPIDWLLPEA